MLNNVVVCTKTICDFDIKANAKCRHNLNIKLNTIWQNLYYSQAQSVCTVWDSKLWGTCESIVSCTLIYVCLGLRFTRRRLKDPNPPRQPAPATSPPRRPPSCPLPQKTRAAVPYHQHHPQFTTRAATAPFRQILMNGTCKYFQKTAELRLLWNQDSKVSLFSRGPTYTHNVKNLKGFLKPLSRESSAWTGCATLLTAFFRFLSSIYFALFFLSFFPFSSYFRKTAQRTPVACYQQVTACFFFFLYIKIHPV